ncbi:MAG: recombinase RecT [Burkholderiales bacterium]|nr:recombinase RecT [Burkholderiales bacterium]
MLAGDTFDKVLRLAEIMASGRATIPKHLQGNVGDCAAVIGQAMRWGMDHIAVAQKTHIVNGTLGYEAQLVVAVLNNSPLLATRINYRWSDGWDGTKGKEDHNAAHWCEVSAMLRGETEPRVLRITMAQVGGVRNSPNWATDARQQLAYLGAKRWGRLHAPDVLLGVYTPDELQFGREDDPLDESQPKPPAVTPARPELPAYADADFAKNLPAWTKLVADGKKTAPDLLATLSTKATFSEAQKASILALKRPVATNAAPPSSAPAPEPAAAQPNDGHDDFREEMEAAEGSQQ